MLIYLPTYQSFAFRMDATVINRSCRATNLGKGLTATENRGVSGTADIFNIGAEWYATNLCLGTRELCYRYLQFSISVEQDLYLL